MVDSVRWRSLDMQRRYRQSSSSSAAVLAVTLNRAMAPPCQPKEMKAVVSAAVSVRSSTALSIAVSAAVLPQGQQPQQQPQQQSLLTETAVASSAEVTAAVLGAGILPDSAERSQLQAAAAVPLTGHLQS